MFAIGNDELARKPLLGKTVKCKLCGKRHKVEYGTTIKDGVKVESKLLAFYSCGKKSYVCGVNGKMI
jgi:hypothetical protein